MSTFILLDGIEPPKACKDCPFINNEVRCCEILSRKSNKAVLVNTYSEYRDKRCPISHIDNDHGRILDEKDIRTVFASMPFGLREVKYSMADVFSNLAITKEIAPRYVRKYESMKNTILNFGESLRRNDKEEIEKEINNAGKDNRI